MTEPVTAGQKENKPDNMVESKQSTAEQRNFLGRKEKRKALKKDKRKQIRKELAAKARAEEEARLNDPEEQRKIQLEEDRENERLERERKEFEERERIFLQELERKKKEEEEDERIKAVERESKLKQEGAEEVLNEDDEWEYVEEGPPEIIWQGNEIIVKKNKVKVKKKEVNQDMEKEDPNRPTSNPLPPQSEAYAAYKSAPVTSAALMDTVAQQVPNFGTEQDKSHCPFHIKTGACRFGSRCNRVHYYPDKSTTLLIKNMYNGPGLAWDQDEGLEYTEEEVEGSYEEFYEDVHTEFLKFGEIINFKVCRNGSFHLRGNVYIQYKSMDSAVMAYNSVQGRYFAAKQVKCEFVSLTRWKVAICGEYMKSRLKTCSRGSACNFLHCFSNPGGDYEWADCDKPPPRYWIKKMSALFGYSDDYWHDKHIDEPSPKHSTRISTSDRDSYYDKKRQRSTETNQHNRSSSRNHHRVGKRRYHEDETNYKYNNHNDEDTDSDGDRLNTHRRHRDGSENHSAHYRSRSRSRRDDYDRHKRTSDSDEEDLYKDKTHVYPKHKSRHRKYDSESSSSDEKESNDAKVEAELQRHNKPHKIRYHHGRSTTKHNRDEEEPYIKKQKTSRSRSRNSSYLLDNHDTSDRWDPNTSPDEHSSGKEHNRKPKDKRSSRETRSGGEVNKFRTKAANSS